jgi:excisionase family DNA binding protein
MSDDAHRMRSVPEVAQYLRIHVDTVYDLVRKHELGAVRVGRRILVTDAQLDAFIDRHTIDGDV